MDSKPTLKYTYGVLAEVLDQVRVAVVVDMLNPL
jgi:hypothetical protein